VHAVVVYESLTGHTRRAAWIVATELERAGVDTTVGPVDRVDLQAVSEADLVVVGTWVDGLILVGQRPGRAAKLRRLPVLHGKKAVVFCTYAIDAGRTLDKLQAIVAGRGAEVLGGMAIRRDDLDEGSRDLAERILALLERTSTGA
jgi:hypothetical protein